MCSILHSRSVRALKDDCQWHIIYTIWPKFCGHLTKHTNLCWLNIPFKILSHIIFTMTSISISFQHSNSSQSCLIVQHFMKYSNHPFGFNIYDAIKGTEITEIFLIVVFIHSQFWCLLVNHNRATWWWAIRTH